MVGGPVPLGREQAGPVGARDFAAEQEDVGFLAGLQHAELGVDRGELGDQPARVRFRPALGRRRLVPGGPAIPLRQVVGGVEGLDRGHPPAPSALGAGGSSSNCRLPRRVLNSPSNAEGYSGTGRVPQLSVGQGGRQRARDGHIHLPPPFAQPSHCWPGLLLASHCWPGLLQAVTRSRPPATNFRLRRPAARSARSARPLRGRSRLRAGPLRSPPVRQPASRRSPVRREAGCDGLGRR